jgi:hypothetical protein
LGFIFLNRPLKPFFFGSSSADMACERRELEILFAIRASRSVSAEEGRESRAKKLGRVGEASETARGWAWTLIDEV